MIRLIWSGLIILDPPNLRFILNEVTKAMASLYASDSGFGWNARRYYSSRRDHGDASSLLIPQHRPEINIDIFMSLISKIGVVLCLIPYFRALLMPRDVSQRGTVLYTEEGCSPVTLYTYIKESAFPERAYNFVVSFGYLHNRWHTKRIFER